MARKAACLRILGNTAFNLHSRLESKRWDLKLEQIQKQKINAVDPIIPPGSLWDYDDML